jgi:hypothetical protein
MDTLTHDIVKCDTMAIIELNTDRLKYITVCDLCRFMPPVIFDDMIVSAVTSSVKMRFPDRVDFPPTCGDVAEYITLVCDTTMHACMIHNRTDQICQALVQGCPVVTVMSVFSEYDGDKHKAGELTMPAHTDSSRRITTCITGFDNHEQLFYARHNKGTDFGYDGYYTMPFEYIQKYITAAYIFQEKTPVIVETPTDEILVATAPIDATAQIDANKTSDIIPGAADPPAVIYIDTTASLDDNIDAIVDTTVDTTVDATVDATGSVAAVDAQTHLIHIDCAEILAPCNRISYMEKIRNLVVISMTNGGIRAIPMLTSNIEMYIGMMIRELCVRFLGFNDDS